MNRPPRRWWPPKERRRTIRVLALPIIGGMASQNVLNLVDTAMVGRLGDAALAAVGMGGFANFMAQAFITGMSSGVQATAARRLGEGKAEETVAALNGGLFLAVGLALPLSAVLLWKVDAIFPLLNDDPEVVALGVPYLGARLVGMVGVGCNFAFRGYWNGIGFSGFYLRTLLVMHSANIVLGYLFIYGKLGFPALGAMGAGVANTIATYLGTALYAFLGWRHARGNGFLTRLPTASELGRMLRLSAPAGLQQFLMAAGFTALFWIIGQVGTAELAAANVLLNISLVGILPGLGLGLAAASLVGQALGRGDPADARRWGWEVVQVAAAVMAAAALPMLLFPDPILRLFLEDAATRELARLPLRVAALGLAADAVGMVLLNALLGAGASRAVMLVAAGCQWGVGLAGAYLVGPVLGGGLMAVWLTQVGYRALQGLIFALLWRRGKWASAEV